MSSKISLPLIFLLLTMYGYIVKVFLLDESVENSRVKAAEQYVKFFSERVIEFCKQNNRLPSSYEFNKISYFKDDSGKHEMLDPWGNRYNYSFFSGTVTISSNGKNLIFDNSEHGDDIRYVFNPGMSCR